MKNENLVLDINSVPVHKRGMIQVKTKSSLL